MSNNIIMFCVTAVDDFGRKFNYNHAVASVDIDYMVMAKRRFYSHLFELQVGDILKRMGTDVYAEWECEIREWDFGASPEV